MIFHNRTVRRDKFSLNIGYSIIILNTVVIKIGWSAKSLYNVNLTNDPKSRHRYHLD